MWFAAAKTAVGAFFPGRLYIYFALALSLFGAGAYSAWQVQNWRQSSNKLAVAEKTIAAVVQQANTDNALTTERVKTITIYKQGATKIVEKIVYETIQNPAPAICDRTPDSLRDIAALINAANGAR